jgi:chromate transporter
VNAAVVGVLIAAFVRPVCSSAVHTILDGAVALVALMLLVQWRIAPWLLVFLVVSLSALLRLV